MAVAVKRSVAKAWVVLNLITGLGLAALMSVVPLRVTTVPTGPFAGVKERIFGKTTREVALTAVPPLVTTLIFPVVAPAGIKTLT